MSESTTRPDLAIGRYDRLTGDGGELAYDFDDLSVDVPRPGPVPLALVGAPIRTTGALRPWLRTA